LFDGRLDHARAARFVARERRGVAHVPPAFAEEACLVQPLAPHDAPGRALGGRFELRGDGLGCAVRAQKR
jgi:hypothetical protein